MVDGGDLFGKRNKNEMHQTRFLCEVTEDFGYDAIGLGEMDLNYGITFLREMIETHNLPFTNANVRDDKGELILPEYLVVKRGDIKFGICSVLDPMQKIITMSAHNEEYTVADPLTTLRELIPRMRQEVDSVVLLGHLAQAFDPVLKELSGVDLAITGHSFKTLKEEKVINKIPVLCSVHEGRTIGRSDVSFDKDGIVQAFEVTITTFDESVADDADMLKRVNDYKEALQNFKVAQRAAFPRDKGSDKETFLGERTCRGCHMSEFDVYAKSGHKKAFSTLRTKGQNMEPECLVCHTTGYTWLNGYAEDKPYNALKDVQCEACHGYGSEHSRDGKWLAQAKDSCVTCHDKENSPEFDYQTYWEKIKH